MLVPTMKPRRLSCEDETCDQKFGSKSAVKKHMKEQHPTEEQLKERENIKCQYCQKNFKTKDNKNEHELGCVGNPEREELKCEVCDLGGGFMSTREYWLTRECAMAGKDKRDEKLQENDR